MFNIISLFPMSHTGESIIGTTEHVLRHSAVPNLTDILGSVSGRELQSALIEDSVKKAGELSVHDVYRQHNENYFVQPCELDQREVVSFEAAALRAIPLDVSMIELSPVSALGTNSIVAGISQKTVLTTIRGTEVLADGVTALTLETAKRKEAEGDWSSAELGTFHRELRTQAHEQPGFTAHFHALSLVSAAKASNPDEFKSDSFARHISTYLDIMSVAKDVGYEAQKIEVAFSNIRVMELLIKNRGLDRATLMRHTQTPGFSAIDTFGVPLPKKASHIEMVALAEDLPEEVEYLRRPLRYTARIFQKISEAIQSRYTDQQVVTSFDLDRHAGIGYYQDACVKISASNNSGETYPLVDIGTSDWLAKITNQRSDRLITGGMGTELFMKKFKA
jgi:hypothetical protein